MHSEKKPGFWTLLDLVRVIFLQREPMAAITADCLLSSRGAYVELGIMGVEPGVTEQGSFVESLRTPLGFQRLPTGPHAESGAPVPKA